MDITLRNTLSKIYPRDVSEISRHLWDISKIYFNICAACILILRTKLVQLSPIQLPSMYILFSECGTDLGYRSFSVRISKDSFIKALCQLADSCLLTTRVQSGSRRNVFAEYASAKRGCRGVTTQDRRRRNCPSNRCAKTQKMRCMQVQFRGN